MKRSSGPIRILFLTSVFGAPGGSEKNIDALLRRIPRARFEPYLIALRGGPMLEEARRDGLNVYEIGLHALLSRKALIEGIRLYRFLRERSIDLLMTCHEDADLFGGVVGWLARVPVRISSKRDMGYQMTRKQRWAFRIVRRMFHRYVTVSHAVKREIARTQGIPESRCEVIYTGIETIDRPSVGAEDLHRLLGVPSDHRIVGMAASFREVKGQEYFVRAAEKVLQFRQDVEFVIAGNKETAYFQKVFRLMQTLGIEKKIHCLGNRSDLPRLLPAFDLFVLSSLHEGFSNAIVEAMAAGLPVIAPHSGGNPEIVDESNGILFEPRDTEGLAKAILRLLENEAERQAMGRRGRELVEKKFSLSGMLRRYERMFSSALGLCV